MVELFLIAAAIAAYYFGYTNGSKEGAEKALSEQRAKVHAGMAPNSAFHNVYGMPGFYLADTSAKLEGMPLITISSSTFLGLVSRLRLSNEATDQEVDTMKSDLASKYLVASGMSADKIAALRQAFATDRAAAQREV
jgi:hypothetical protein